MRFLPIEVKDKLGRTIILRGVETTDAANLIKYLKDTTTETPFLIREPEEVTLTIEQEVAFLQGRIEAERELMLVATLDAELIGSCSLMSAGPFCRYTHRCNIAIAVYEKYWGFGIGELMMRALLDIAKQVGYEQAELEVVADNHAGVQLYQKLGFEEYGRFPKNMKYQDGTYADAIWMMKHL